MLFSCKSKKYFGFIILGCLFIFMLSRAKYGYIYNDEPFILTLGHRFMKGDLILWDEWHPTQMTGYLNYLLTSIYFMFFSTTDGMILNFRYISIAIWFAILLVVYCRFSKFSKQPLIAAVACSYLLLFSSMDIMTVSYNLYSLSGILLCFTFIATGNKYWEYFLAGVFFSVATLASPYLSIIFILYYISFAITKWILKKYISKKRIDVTLYVLYGVLVSIFLFFGFFFVHGGTFDKLFKTIKFIFSDEAYPTRTFAQIFRGYLGTAFLTFYYFAIILLITYLVPFIFKRSKLKWFEIHCILFAVLIHWMVWHYHYITTMNKQVVQITFLGFHALLLDKSRNKIYTALYFIGMLFSIVLYCTSDLHVIATSMALSISGFASFFLIFDYLDKNENKKCIKKILIIAIAIAQIWSQMFLRKQKYYFDWAVRIDPHYEITDSVAKGIYAPEDKYNEYYEIYEDIETYIPKGAKLCSISQNPWIYLANDSIYSTCSSWMSEDKDYKIKRLKEFYNLHPEKIPEYVYIMKKDFEEDYITELFTNYEVIEGKNAYILKLDLGS